jgi:hypothetical protein
MAIDPTGKDLDLVRQLAMADELIDLLDQELT